MYKTYIEEKLREELNIKIDKVVCESDFTPIGMVTFSISLERLTDIELTGEYEALGKVLIEKINESL